MYNQLSQNARELRRKSEEGRETIDYLPLEHYMHSLISSPELSDLRRNIREEGETIDYLTLDHDMH